MMKDFKKMPKMATGGKVSYQTGGAIASKQVFDRDFEGSRKDYLRNKTQDDPSASEMSSRLGQGDEEAEGALSKAHIRAAKKRDELFKLKRDLGMKSGGKVKRGNKVKK